MNYPESENILEKIKSVEKILVNCHRSTDLDSVASAMSLKQVLELMGKKVFVFCPEPIPQIYKFVPGAESIVEIDPKKIKLSDFDLWFFVDTEKFDHAGLDDMIPKIEKVNVDHHPGSNIDASVGIVDPMGSSTCELLYLLFEDWEINIDKELATTLLAGMTQDTNFFQQKNTTARSHDVASKLMRLGADNNFIAFKVKRSNEFGLVKFWGELGRNLEIDSKYRFVWSAVPYNVFKKYNVKASATSEYSNMIGRTIDGTNFSIIMAEKKPKFLTMSIRARVSGFDVRLIASELGGGGHKDACGASVSGLPFEKAVEKTLKAARKYANQKFIPEVPLD